MNLKPKGLFRWAAARFQRSAPPKGLGPLGEDHAAAYLTRQGFQLLARNVQLGRNEIDIIAREGDTIVFVEVRSRSAMDSVAPEDSVGPRKQAHVRRAAAQYLARHQDRNTYYRFDVVTVVVTPQGSPQVTHFRDAF